MHLNIQSIVPKLELIAAEYSCHELLSFTESWLSPQVSNEAILLPGYKTPFRRDRVGKAGGGVIVYVKDNLNCSERRDLVVCGIECIWLEVRFKTKKYLYGTFYVPPNSSPQRQSRHSPLQIDDDLICEDTKKGKKIHDYFCGQSNLDDSNTHLPDIPDTRTDGLGDMTISGNERLIM
ncbi:unnamed protein product [Mytilus edulis]|uniref:Uncharacterized protein n=1 Tax=Mytilus edulis TaxID=6550 RepID=A0A8S3QE70_MYTED|nr:unnamed protein product [Mytilus edulis]